MSIPPTTNEATTRSQLVDVQLAHAGWSKSRPSLIEEFVLMAMEPEGEESGQQFADYVLLGGDLWDEHCDKLTDQARRRLPLRSIRFLAPGG